MRGLMSRLGGRDRGSMAPLVAVLLSGGILFGAAAVVVDVGRVYAEREELQNGADAAALAAATACARLAGIQQCTPDALLAAAEPVASRNASDGAVDVLPMCGLQNGNALLGECQPVPQNLTGCVGDRPTAGNYVEIQASTRESDGSRLLPSTFSRALAGASWEGSTVAACSRVAWGAALSVPEAFKVMISDCAWTQLTGGGTRIAAKPTTFPWVPPPGQEVTVRSQVTGCTGDDNMATLIGPSVFTCIDGVQVNQEYVGFDAKDLIGLILSGIITAPCRFLTSLVDLGNLFAEYILGLTTEPRIVYLPVYSRPTAPLFLGRNYDIVGLAPFIITAVDVGSYRYPPSVLGGPVPCSPNPCMNGYFVKDTIQGPYGGQGNYGLSGVKLAG